MSNNKKKASVRIVNAQSGCGYTNLARAERHVRRGVAELFRDEQGFRCLRFIEPPQEGKAAIIAAAVRQSMDFVYDRATAGMATEQQARNLPMVMVGKAFGRGRRGVSPSRPVSVERLLRDGAAFQSARDAD